ncbi:MAG: family 16 glycosylhydrolase [Chloroflexi bacterium]|jgi:beta-glucanase (GH16 family)|nr:family 16 glycosylhydrolase [Chloroflexota bacterium]
MKSYIFCVLIGLALLSACASAATPAPATPTVTPTPDPTGVLVWADEFDAPDGSAVDPKKWRFDTGTGGDGWGNNELQYYTDTTDNAYIEDGNLVIKAEAVDSWERYTSARLVTHGEASWLYGRFEIRAKLPIGQGIWPAI